jgi:uncharacterized membrane protein
MNDEATVDARFQALEARIASLEAAARSRLSDVNVAAPHVNPAQTAAAAAAAAATRLRIDEPLRLPPAPPKPSPRPAAPATHAAPASRPAAPAGPSWSAVIADLEEKLTGRALAVVGGVALVVGAVFFLSLAFSRGWIGPEGRVLIGVGAAGIALALGAWMLDHRQPIVGRVLVAVGLAVVSLAAFAATRLYGLVPVEVGLVMTLVASIAAAFLAVRHDAQIIAVLALIAVLGAPPVLGASPTLATVADIGSVLASFAALALFRTWRWLPSIAFALAAPQLASWLSGDVVPAVGLVAAVIFWVLNAVAAGGEEYLRPAAKRELRLGSATLLLANAAFFIWAGFTVLSGPNEFLRGPFLIAVALAHVVIGGWFLLREGDRHPFGLLAAGTGVAALAMAAPVQFGGPPVPIAWAAEAAALAWLASRRAHPQALLAAAVLGALAFGHLVGIEYPAGTASPIADAGAWPFVNASGLSLAFLLGAATVAAWSLRSRTIAATIASLGVLAVLFAAPHELAGPSLIAAWVALAVGALALDRYVIDRLPVDGPVAVPLLVELRSAVLAAAAMVGAVALGHALVFDLPINSFGTVRPPAIPFSDERAQTLEFLVIGAAISGWVYLRRLTLELPAVAALVVAGSILVYGSVFEVYADAAIVIAAGLAAAGFALGRVRGVAEDAWRLSTGAGLVMAGIGTAAALGVVAGPDFLSVANIEVADHPPFISSATVACAAIVAALAVGVRLNRSRPFAPWAGLAAGTLAVYGLSIGVVDLFQARIPGPIAFEEVATQAQVAMSVLWIVLGAVVFMFGLGRRHLVVRQAGLALLGLASLKVFVFDLASLDVAYRVLSLVALGTFLLITAWVYARLRPPTGEPLHPTEPDARTTDSEAAVA